jgi:hypothetical protein
MVWLGSLGSTPRMSNFDPHWLLLLPFPVGVTFAIVLLFRRSSHARSGLERWASTKKYVILHFEKCFFCGAFPWWTTSQKQMVYFVTIRDDSGRERSCWLRFGSFWGGGYKDEPDVIWRDANAA